MRQTLTKDDIDLVEHSQIASVFVRLLAEQVLNYRKDFVFDQLCPDTVLCLLVNTGHRRDYISVILPRVMRAITFGEVNNEAQQV